MKRLLGLFKNLVGKFKGMSKVKKIAFAIIFLALLSALTYLIFFTRNNQYSVLFSNMDKNDVKTVLDKLDSKKEKYKVSGNSIYVPKADVDELRLELAPDMTNGSKGFELFDNGNKFGMTDQEMKIEYQRALEGELERTFKSFSQVENARVHLVMPDDSVFVKDDTTKSSATVTLKLKNGQDLSEGQVKAMVALMCGAVKNLPQSNVQIIDENMRLLTDGLYGGGSSDDSKNSEAAASAAQKEQKITQEYEKKLETKLSDMLGQVYGKDKIKVNVNAILDFDDVQKDSVKVDPDSKAVVSEKTSKDSSNGQNAAGSSGSSVDNNVSSDNSNPIKDAASSASGTNHEETVTNYDTGKTETKTIAAPGKVKRLTASVALDGALDDATKTSIINLVNNAIGIDESRGDTVSVEGIHFDTSLKDKAAKDIDEMNKAEQDKSKNKLYAILGIGLAAVVLAIILFIYFKKKNEDELEEEEEVILPENNEGIDTVIGDEVEPKKPEEIFKPIDFEAKDSKNAYVESEIKKYAVQKPDQVVDIIKSWLTEDER